MILYQDCMVVGIEPRDMTVACIRAASINLAERGFSALKCFLLPVGMLDSVPRPHSPPRVTIRGGFAFGLGDMSQRVGFFVDGFNLYHSVAQFSAESGDQSVKWLDLHGLAKGMLPLVGPLATLRSIHYFTALPEHLYLSDPGRLSRHRIYVRALTAHGDVRPTVTYGRIARQKVQVNVAGAIATGSIWREKGTDVALAMALVRAAANDDLDEAVVVSGDADYLPAVETLRVLHPRIGLRFAFPRGRASKELSREAPKSFTLTSTAYLSHRLPECIRLPSGKSLHCPVEWRRP